MIDDLVEGGGFGGMSPVVLEFILCLFPRVAPEHTGLFGEVRLVGVWELVRSTDRVQIRLQEEPGACGHECGECLSELRIINRQPS